jgi:hypothetical protein
MSAQPGSLQPDFAEDGLSVRPDYSWQRRSAKTWADRNRWYANWSFGCAVGGVLEEYGVVGRDLASAGGYEPFSCDGDGTQSIKWITGKCVDAGGSAAAGSIVQAFRTSDDAFAGEVNANSTDGSFNVPTPFVGANHYLVAYKPGSPDIGGTTVNTLVPTNIDGT